MAKKAAKKKSPAKKAAKKTTTAKKASTKKTAAKKTTTAKKKTAAKKPLAKKLVKKVAVAKKLPNINPAVQQPAPVASGAKPKKLPVAFLRKQQQKLLDLRDSIVDQMNGVARETLRGSGDGTQSFGMHQADAGSDSYDRDFALNLLSKEQDALEEIDKALKRIDDGSYGICEESGEPIPQLRLEAMPFAKMTVACQERSDSQSLTGPGRQPVTSLFGLDEKEKKVSS